MFTKKKIILLLLCCMSFGLVACGTENRKESGLQTESIPGTEAEQTIEATADLLVEQSEDKTDALTQEQALEAIKNYCFINNPDLEGKADSDEYTVYWEVATNEAGEIVVLYRSYTGSETRYYIDPISGETYVTELVPGIIDDEQRTDESFNVRDYLD